MTPTNIDRDKKVFVTIVCQCKNGHEWQIVLPKYYFSLKSCQCPSCHKPVVCMKAGEPQTIEQIRKSTS